MKTLIKNAQIIDGTGKKPFKGSFVIENDLIKSITYSDQQVIAEENNKIIDATNKFVIPGIINCHVHLGMNAGTHPMKTLASSSQLEVLLLAVQNAKKALKKGITTVRDCGALEYEILVLRDHINNGSFIGPRILASQALKMSGGHFSGRTVDGSLEAKKAVREQIHAGVDFVKLMASGGLGRPNEDWGAPELDIDEMAAAIQEGKKHHLKTAAHAHGKQSILNAIAAGADTLEHVTFLDEEVIEHILKNDVVVIPTFQPYYEISVFGAEAGMPSYMVESAKIVYAEKLPRFQNALKAGIKVAFGTDGGAPLTPAEDVVTEAQIMNEMGMNPMEVIVSYTLNAAKAIGLDNIVGSLENGKLADVVILNNDPLEKLSNLGDVYAVFKDGKLVE